MHGIKIFTDEETEAQILISLTVKKEDQGDKEDQWAGGRVFRERQGWDPEKPQSRRSTGYAVPAARIVQCHSRIKVPRNLTHAYNMGF